MNVVWLAVIMGLIFIDQAVKLWAVNFLAPIETIKIITGFLSFTYVENRGAAFGIFEGNKWILVGLTSVILLVMMYLLFFGKLTCNVEKICLSMFIAGGAGNLIDRIRLGFVVDYIDINQWFSYPMFNFADCCVVIAATTAIILIFAKDFKEKSAVKQSQGENDGNDNDNCIQGR